MLVYAPRLAAVTCCDYIGVASRSYFVMTIANRYDIRTGFGIYYIVAVAYGDYVASIAASDIVCTVSGSYLICA